MLRHIVVAVIAAVAALLGLGVTAAGAEEPTLEVTSPGSRCDTPLTFRGEGYEPYMSVRIEVAYGYPFDDKVTTVPVDATGSFEVTTGSLVQIGVSCAYGRRYVFKLRDDTTGHYLTAGYDPTSGRLREVWVSSKPLLPGDSGSTPSSHWS